jgi:uncharacterized protein
MNLSRAALAAVPLFLGSVPAAWAGTDLTIAATGQASVPPDEATASLNIQAQEATAAKAQAAVNDAMAKVLHETRAVPGVKAVTGGYSTYTVTPDNNGPQKFVAQQSLTLSQPATGGVPSAGFSKLVGDLQQEGLLLNALEGDLSDSGQRQAQQAAIQDALAQIDAQAAAIAATLHQQVGQITSLDVNASSGPAPRPLMMARMAAAAPAPPQSSPDNVQVTASVTAKIELQPKP